MSGKTRKMVNLSIEETSGVDHPAHLHEGWLVMKAAKPSDVADVLRKSEDEADNQSTDQQEELVANEDTVAEETGKVSEASEPTEPEDIIKSAPEAVRKMFEDMQKAADEAVAKAAAAEETLAKERAERADEAAIAKAREQYANLGLNAEQVGPAMRRLAEFDADLAKSVEDALVAANAKSESADLFAEIGKSQSTTGSAYEQADVLAKAAVADGRADTFAQALTDVFASQPDLYNQYLADQGK